MSPPVGTNATERTRTHLQVTHFHLCRGYVKTIKLSRGYYALVDDDFQDEFGGLGWFAIKITDTRVYAARWSRGGLKNRKLIYMHRYVLGKPTERDVDHIDGNGLNNQRGNLRWASRSDNQANKGISKQNTSGYKGVTWNKRLKKWQASISRENQTRYISVHKNIEDAARAYDRECLRVHGEFAVLNFPNSTRSEKTQ